MPGRRSRQVTGKRRPPSRALVDAALGVLAANLGVLAGWTQSALLRVVVGAAFFVVTIVGVVVHLRLRPHVPASLSSQSNIPFFSGRTTELDELDKRHQQGRAKAAAPATSGPLLLA